VVVAWNSNSRIFNYNSYPTVEIKPPLKEISYFGTMLPLKTKDFLIKVLNSNGQPFGVDWSGPACKVNSAWPCDKTYYQYLGLGAHNGIDMPCKTGTPVYAAHDGVVVEASIDPNAGIGLVLWDKFQKIKTVYWHHQENFFRVGQEVKQGQQIALADNTGYSLGSHLHFMLKQTDYMGNTINLDNGFKGAIDPIPYLVFEENMTEQEVKHLYALAFYRLPDAGELGFWVGKSLAEFLKTAIKDRADFLNQQ